MADLSGSESSAYFGRDMNAQDIANDKQRMQSDPLGYWWSLMTGDKSTVGGTAANAAGVNNPNRSPNMGAAMAAALGMARDVRNADTMNGIYQAGINAAPRVNPYSTTIADQSRAQQLANLAAMRAQIGGASVAGMQGAQGLYQNGQQALQAAAMGGSGARAAMVGAGQVGQGMAGDVARARLAEVMKQQGALGAGINALRGNDQQSAELNARYALQQRQQDDALRQFYASQGMNLANARQQAGVDRLATMLALKNKYDQRDIQTGMGMANSVASVAGAAAGA